MFLSLNSAFFLLRKEESKLLENVSRNIATPGPGTTSRSAHSAAHSTAADVHDIIEVDEEGDIENLESKPEIDIELVQNETSPTLNKKEDLSASNREV